MIKKCPPAILFEYDIVLWRQTIMPEFFLYIYIYMFWGVCIAIGSARNLLLIQFAEVVVWHTPARTHTHTNDAVSYTFTKQRENI